MESGKGLLNTNLEKRKTALKRILDGYKISERKEIESFTS
jgi:hypothetical protein